MKKISLILFVAMIAMNTPQVRASNTTVKATPVSTVVVNSAASDQTNKLSDEDVNRMIDRLNEIKNMDRSNMTRVEKRELRKEVLAIRDRLRKDHNTYVYISGLGLVLIIILLIILL